MKGARETVLAWSQRGRPCPVLVVAVLALLLGAVTAPPAMAAELLHYPSSQGAFTWPSDAQWVPVSTETEGRDGVAAENDFVGDATYPGIYSYADASYVYFRLRVAYTGTVVKSPVPTFDDATFVMLSTDGDSAPEFAFTWDSKSGAIERHGLEMQWQPVYAATWNSVRFDDFDGQDGQKILSGTGVNWDINLSGQGYVRTVDGVACSGSSWGASTCTLIDFAVAKSYLDAWPGKLPASSSYATWVIQAGSLHAATDHNTIATDIARGANPETTLDGGWGSPTLAVISAFDAYAVDGHALVAWRTSSEAGTAGFLLERRHAGGAWVEVTPALLPAHFSPAATGVCAVEDAGAPAGGRALYRLREIEIGGGTQLYGPFAVTPAGSAPDDIVAARCDARQRMATLSASPDTRAEAPRSGAAVAAADEPAALRVELAESGLYVLRAEVLAEALRITPAAVRALLRAGELELSTQGRPVAVRAASDGSALYFFGEALASPYAAHTTYMLRRGLAAAMANARASRASGTVATSVPATVHAERDALPLPSLFADADADFWLWSYLLAGEGSRAAIDLGVEAPQAVDGGRLAVALQGITVSGAAQEHHVVVSLNGVELGDVRWSGATARAAAFDLPPGVLRAGANTVHVAALLDAGIPYSLVGIDAVDIEYQRACVAVADEALLHPDLSGLLRLSGLSSRSAWVLDVTEPRLPRKLRRVVAAGGPGAASVTFPATAERTYLVAAPAAARTPLAVTGVAPAGLRRTDRAGAGYVVITAPELAGAARELAAYRAAAGMSALVVTTQQIYDEFSDGMPNPLALRRFLEFAQANWTPAPRYVALAGEGSYDYRNLLGHDDALVPSLLVGTPFGLASSDAALTDADGDGLSDVAVGRIPAQTVAELEAYTAKLAAYEAAAGSWRSRVLLAADQTDGAGDFAGDSRRAASGLPAALDVQTLFAGEMGAAAARRALLTGFGDGALLVNYAGHGGVRQLAAEGLLTAEDVAAMANAPRLPVVATMSCVVGAFGLPGVDSLAESLTKSAAGGAIAVWAPSALQMHRDSMLLDELFLQALLGSPSAGARLGDAVREAQKGFIARGGAVAAARTYCLLGDPALIVSR